MKKIFKIFTVIALIATTCLLFCSCSVLSIKKSDIAYWSDESYGSVIEHMDNQYIILNGSVKPIFLQEHRLSIETPDVPVLMTGTLQYYGRNHTNKDRTVIRWYDSSYDRYRYYCREDVFDKYKNAADSVIDNYYILAEIRIKNSDYESGYYRDGEKPIAVGNDMRNAINETLKNGLIDANIDLESFGFENLDVTLFDCDQDMLVTSEKVMEFYEFEDHYFLTATESNSENVKIYEVPNKHFQTVANFVSTDHNIYK